MSAVLSATKPNVEAGQVYRARVGSGNRFRYIRIESVRSRDQNPYALAREVTASGNEARGYDRGADRTLAITVALVYAGDGRWLTMPGNYEFHMLDVDLGDINLE